MTIPLTDPFTVTRNESARAGSPWRTHPWRPWPVRDPEYGEEYNQVNSGGHCPILPLTVPGPWV